MTMPRPQKPWYNPTRREWSISVGGTKRYLFRGRNNPTDQARAWKLAAERGWVAGGATTGKPVTILHAIEAWLKQNPGDWYVDILKPFEAWTADLKLADVHGDTLDEYLTYLQRHTAYSASTIRRQVRFARTVLRWAHVRGLTTKPVPDMPKLPPIPRIARDIPHDDLQKTFDQLPVGAKPVLSFMLMTGCRPGEACLLRYDEIKGTQCELHRGKTWKRTGRPRIIHLTDDAMQLITSQETTTGYVFLNRNGTPYKTNGIRLIFKRAGERAGVTLTGPNMLRHTYAQNAVDVGIDSDSVGAAIGHELGSPETKVYVRIRDERARQAVQSLDVPISLDSIQTPKARGPSPPPTSAPKTPRRKRGKNANVRSAGRRTA